MLHETQTWHYGLMAQHWAQFENHNLLSKAVSTNLLSSLR